MINDIDSIQFYQHANGITPCSHEPQHGSAAILLLLFLIFFAASRKKTSK
jgi:hypothetical protein